jgi:4-hydroxybenzoate polyprenyltransferase
MAAFATRLPLEEYTTSLATGLVGAFLLRSSACTINDIFDRKVDAGVGVYVQLSPGSRVSWCTREDA